MEWYITKGPNPGRCSSNVHGPATTTGGRHVVDLDTVRWYLERLDYPRRSPKEADAIVEFLKTADGRALERTIG